MMGVAVVQVQPQLCACVCVCVYACVCTCVWQEEIVDDLRSGQEWTWEELLAAYRNRFIVNVIVLGLLSLAGWLIYLATIVSIEASRSGQSPTVCNSGVSINGCRRACLSYSVSHFPVCLLIDSLK